MRGRVIDLNYNKKYRRFSKEKQCSQNRWNLTVLEPKKKVFFKFFSFQEVLEIQYSKLLISSCFLERTLRIILVGFIVDQFPREINVQNKSM